MSRQQLSSEAHKNLPHANPLSLDQMSDLLEAALVRRPRTALEIGCGAGGFSIELAKRHGVHVVALDTNPYALERAMAAASKAQLIGTVEFRHKPAADFNGEPVDLVVCIGASQAFGTPRQALQALRGLLAPNGTLVFAELSWSAKPPSEYLQYLATSEGDYWTAKEAEHVFAEAGLKVETIMIASADSWTQYEAGVLHGRLEFAKTLAPDQAAEIVETSTEWFRLYEAHGRHCLGLLACVATRSDG
jgi:cyclopropane fatty-acyl-phospholipid synthase-like methyltransferase